jgi:hypothetical protein
MTWDEPGRYVPGSGNRIFQTATILGGGIARRVNVRGFQDELLGLRCA